MLDSRVHRAAEMMIEQDIIPRSLNRNLSKYRNDPVAFVKDFIKFPKDQGLVFYQEEILASIISKRRVAVRSPHGAGKTMLASCAALWAVMTSEDVKVCVTASVWRQLSKYFFPEFHKWARRLDWKKLGRAPFTKQELQVLSLKLSPTQECFAVASDNPESIEGAHADRVFFLLDESKAIPDATWDSVEGALSTGDVFCLAISTPGNRAGRFYDIHRHAPGYEGWWTRQITLEETISAGRVNAEWAEDRLEQWGIDSPVYQSKVLGEFPEQSENALFSLNWIEEARERELPIDETMTITQGCDIARFGDDSSCSFVGTGDVVLEADLWHGNDLMASSGRIKAKGYPAKVDVIGMGGGVVDRLRELGFPVTPINFSESPIDKEHYRDVRDEAYHGLSKRFKSGNIDLTRISEQIYSRLCGELTAMGYDYTSDGKIAVWPKKKIKETTGHSPDCADTLAILFCGSTFRQGQNEAVKVAGHQSRWANDLGTRTGSRWKR